MRDGEHNDGDRDEDLTERLFGGAVTPSAAQDWSMYHKPIITAGGASATLPWTGLPALRLGMVSVLIILVGLVLLRSEIWRSARLSDAAALEITMYVVVPWAMVLPWSVLYPLTLLAAAGHVLGSGEFLGSGSATAFTVSAIIWYAVSFAPTILAGYSYWRQNTAYGRLRSLLTAHLFQLTVNNVAYLACWRASYRLLTGVTGWDKTGRVTTDEAVAPAGSAGLGG